MKLSAKHTRLHWCRKGVEGAKGFKNLEGIMKGKES
jgi:hypothetical protein